MIDNEKITDMTQEEIENLSYEKMELFSSFKDIIENYSESIYKVQVAKNSASNKIRQKNNFLKVSKRYIPIKVYCESLGSLILFGVVTSYYIMTSVELQITQSYARMYIFLLYILLIVLAALLPFLILPKKIT